MGVEGQLLIEIFILTENFQIIVITLSLVWEDNLKTQFMMIKMKVAQENIVHQVQDMNRNNSIQLQKAKKVLNSQGC